MISWDLAQTLKPDKPRKSIGLVDEEHKFLHENEYIHTGYRINFSTTKRILRSLFMCHNESFNIWTHLIGLVVFFVLLWYSIEWLGISTNMNLQLDKSEVLDTLRDAFLNSFHYGISVLETVSVQAKSLSEQLETEILSLVQTAPETNMQEAILQRLEVFRSVILEKIETEDLAWLGLRQIDLADQNQYLARWPIYIFVISAMICLGCSTVYHLFSAHSHKAHKLTSTLDYAGISILIAGSFYPAIYYIYYCHEELIIIYLAGISIFSVGVFLSSFSPTFHKPKYNWLRGLTFLILGCLGLIPCLNLIFLPEASEFSMSLYYYLGMALSYVVGVTIYIFRVPERFFPGKLDLIGNSHNIWHIFVLAAAIIHYLGAVDSFYTRQRLTC